MRITLSSAPEDGQGGLPAAGADVAVVREEEILLAVVAAAEGLHPGDLQGGVPRRVGVFQGQKGGLQGVRHHAAQAADGHVHAHQPGAAVFFQEAARHVQRPFHDAYFMHGSFPGPRSPPPPGQ